MQSAAPRDDDTNVLRDLQSLSGPQLDNYITKYLDKVLAEEGEFEELAGRLSEAIELLDPGSTKRIREELKEVEGEDGSISEAKEGEEPLTTTAKEGKDGLSPAERVVNLLSLATNAAQPLLQRIIHSSDKDLTQLLAQLDTDELLASKQLPPLQRPLVDSPNTLDVDTLVRKESPLNGLVDVGQGMREEDREEEVKRTLEEWMKTGNAERTKGRKGGVWNRRERRRMAKLLEKASTQSAVASEQQGKREIVDPEALVSEEETGIDLKKLESLRKEDEFSIPDEKWFTTTPSIGLTQPSPLPRTHSIPSAILHFRSHHPHLLALQKHFVLHSASFLGIPVSAPVSLPTKRTLITVLKSPFVHKKSMENWERRVYKGGLKVWDVRPELLRAWLAYLERNAIAGVGMRITRWEWVGLDMLQAQDGGETLQNGLKEKEWKAEAKGTVNPSIAEVPPPAGRAEATM